MLGAPTCPLPPPPLRTHLLRRRRAAARRVRLRRRAHLRQLLRCRSHVARPPRLCRLKPATPLPARARARGGRRGRAVGGLWREPCRLRCAQVRTCRGGCSCGAADCVCLRIPYMCTHAHAYTRAHVHPPVRRRPLLPRGRLRHRLQLLLLCRPARLVLIKLQWRWRWVGVGGAVDANAAGVAGARGGAQVRACSVEGARAAPGAPAARTRRSCGTQLHGAPHTRTALARNGQA